MSFPAIRASAACLAHVPSQVRYGSKPVRELSEEGPWRLAEFLGGLRSYEDAVGYAPNQVFIGNLAPDALHDVELPCFEHRLPDAVSSGPFGEILSEHQYYGLLTLSDHFDLLWLEEGLAREAAASLDGHPLLKPGELAKISAGLPRAEIERHIKAGALPLWIDRDHLAGCMMPAHDKDEALTARVLLENLACKATGMWALRSALSNCDGVQAESIEYILGCGEEAVGDRYQRGGGGLAKAFGEMAGCIHATGADLKVFCDSPVHAIVSAAAYVQAGVFKQVAVVGGGSFAKLGMKFQGHLNKGMPILEDVLGAIAVVVGEPEGTSPHIRLDSIGKHDIGVDARPQAMAEVLTCTPLDRLGWRMTDIDKYATEMHNPEITQPVGSGNVPRTNYLVLGSLAARRGELSMSELETFVHKHGMPGFAPTQGHIASAVAYLGHALRDMKQGRMRRSLFMAKGSLFLGRMTHMADGMSFILESPNHAHSSTLHTKKEG